MTNRTEAMIKARRILYTQPKAWFCTNIEGSSHNLRILYTVDPEELRKWEANVYCLFQSDGYPIDLWKMKK